MHRKDFIKAMGAVSLMAAGGILWTPSKSEAATVVGPNGQLVWMDDAGNVNVHRSDSNPEYNGQTVSPEKLGLRPEDIMFPEDRLHPDYKGEEIIRKGVTSLTKVLEKLNIDNVGEDEVAKVQNWHNNRKSLKKSDFTRDELFEIAGNYKNSTLDRVSMTIDFANHYGIPAKYIPRVIALFNQESGFNPVAMAKTSTATGITQILQGTAEEFGIRIRSPRTSGFDDRLVDSISIDGGVRIIKDYVQQIQHMYFRPNNAYKDLDGVYFAGTGAWKSGNYPKGLRSHRMHVQRYVPDSKRIFKKHQKLRNSI